MRLSDRDRALYGGSMLGQSDRQLQYYNEREARRLQSKKGLRQARAADDDVPGFLAEGFHH